MARGGLLMAQVLFINGAVRISVLIGGGSYLVSLCAESLELKLRTNTTFQWCNSPVCHLELKPELTQAHITLPWVEVGAHAVRKRPGRGVMWALPAPTPPC